MSVTNVLGVWSTTMTTEKHITIPDEQAEFIDDMNLSISGVVQDRLDEMMQRYDYQPADNG
jgi:hypothetical protein